MGYITLNVLVWIPLETGPESRILVQGIIGKWFHEAVVGERRNEIGKLGIWSLILLGSPLKWATGGKHQLLAEVYSWWWGWGGWFDLLSLWAEWTSANRGSTSTKRWSNYRWNLCHSHWNVKSWRMWVLYRCSMSTLMSIINSFYTADQLTSLCGPVVVAERRCVLDMGKARTFER